MIATFVGYATLVSLLFGLATLGTERVLTARGLPRRLAWSVCLLASLIFPLAMALNARPAPAPVRSAPVIATPTETESLASPGESPAPVRTVVPGLNSPQVTSVRGFRSLVSLDSILRAAWLVSSSALLTLYLLGTLCLRAKARHWPEQQLDGTTVRVTDGLGPAVLRYLRPQIVVPPWVLKALPPIRRMVLAHEREHVAGRDPLLLLGGLIACALAPWNIPLWWQLRRLRFAIEVDCDARVLRHGEDAGTYAEMLLAVSQSRRRVPLGAVALTERSSELERRIRALVNGRSPSRRWFGAAGLALASILIVAATWVSAPPLIDSTSNLRKRPPEDISLGSEWARSAARARYPELFDQEFDGTAVVSLVFNPDGSVHYATKEMFPPGKAPSHVQGVDALEAAGGEVQDEAYAGDEDWVSIGPWLESKNTNRVDVVYAVLKWPIDPARSAARVAAAVRAQFPQLLKDQYQRNVVVFMKDDGTVDRIDSEIIAPGFEISLGLDDPKRFAALGIEANQIGRHGVIYLEGHLSIGYAWPRRLEETLQQDVGQRVAREDTTDDRAIIDHYFADASQTPLHGGERRWILLGRDGQIWATGRGLYLTDTVLLSEIEARFPGIKVSEYWHDPPYESSCLGANETERHRLGVQCVWLTAGSPVTDEASVDLSRRPDVFLEAHVQAIRAGSHGYRSVPTPLKFGQWGAPDVCWALARIQAPGCSLRFLARDVGQDQVEITVGLQLDGEEGIQPLPGGTSRVRYGEQASIPYTDSDARLGVRFSGILVRPVRIAEGADNSTGAAGGSPGDVVGEMLAQLRSELAQVRAGRAAGTGGTLQRADLKVLVGVARSRIGSILGPPDFCAPATGDRNDCRDSPRWTYFFYRFQPPSSHSLSPDVVELTVAAGGGWGLEVHFSDQDIATAASWVEQR